MVFSLGFQIKFQNFYCILIFPFPSDFFLFLSFLFLLFFTFWIILLLNVLLFVIWFFKFLDAKLILTFFPSFRSPPFKSFLPVIALLKFVDNTDHMIQIQATPSLHELSYWQVFCLDIELSGSI